MRIARKPTDRLSTSRPESSTILPLPQGPAGFGRARGTRRWAVGQTWRTAWVLCLGLAAACLAGDAPTPPAPSFRIMSYNIHHGVGLDDKLDLERIADLIRREKADLVALQEVDKGVERTQRRDLSAELARLTGLSCVFSNNYAFQGGEYGNAILSRWPIIRSRNTHFEAIGGGEPRGLLEAALEVGGRSLTFMATHLDHRRDVRERMACVAEIERLALGLGQTAVVVAGDFNDVPGGRMHDRMRTWARDAWAEGGSGDGFTIPADLPRRRIDYVWIARRSELEVLKAWVPDLQASDHRPLVVECRWKNP